MSEKITILPTKEFVEALIVMGGSYNLLEKDWKADKCEICGREVVYHTEELKKYRKVCMWCAEKHYPEEFYGMMKRAYIKGMKKHLDRTRYIQ